MAASSFKPGNAIRAVLRSYPSPSGNLRLCLSVSTSVHGGNASKKRTKGHQPLASPLAGSNGEDAIRIPDRIPREPTSILKALASTVGRDPMGMHHRFIDDPTFLPMSYTDDKSYVMSLSAGRSAAQHAIHSWPLYFLNDPSSPTVPSWTPHVVLHTGNTEQSLDEKVRLGLIEQAIEVYKNIKQEGGSVEQRVLLRFFDLLCCHNCGEMVEQPLMEKRFYISEQQPSTWRAGGLADELFLELSDKYPETYVSMICGLARFNSHQEAFTLYQKGMSLGLKFPVEVHNAILGGIATRLTNTEGVWQAVQETFTCMEEQGVLPDLWTFNAALLSLTRLPFFTPRAHYAAMLLQEMEDCGIEPSLGSYSVLLGMIYSLREAKSNQVLHWVMRRVHDRDLQLRHPYDKTFFSRAMAAASKLNDVETAHTLYKLSERGLNKSLLGTHQEHQMFYNTYLTLVAASEPMNKLMDIYRMLVPSAVIPSAQAFLSVLDAVQLYEGEEHLQHIFSDVMTMKKFGDQELINKIVKLMSKKHPDPQVQQSFISIIDNLYETWQRETTLQRRDLFKITASMLLDFINIALNCGNLERAVHWFGEFRHADNVRDSVIQPNTLLKLTSVLLQASMKEQLLEVIHVLRDLGFSQQVYQLIEAECGPIPSELREDILISIGNPMRSTMEERH